MIDSLLLGDFNLEVDVVVAVAEAIHVLDAFALQSDSLVRLHPWRNLMVFTWAHMALVHMSLNTLRLSYFFIKPNKCQAARTNSLR